MKIWFVIFSLTLFIYMLFPGPQKISDSPALPDSVKSTLEGDTIQIPNVSAYFSNNYRAFVTDFYRKEYQKDTWFPFPPIRINHPPEFAFTTIKKHTDSTYLEEFVYPLKGSLYVNGFEPFYENGDPKFPGATKFEVDGKTFYTKVTLRFYPSSVGIRLVVWFGIVISVLFIWRLGKRIIYAKGS